MKKIFKSFRENIFVLSSLFLLAFIPLYPKLPIINVQHTWVYVRLEDFFVALVLAIWAGFFIKRKISLKTPLTMPILFYWIIGGIATLHGVLLIFPTVSDVFSNVAFFSYLRRIEYMSLFFIAYEGIKNRKDKNFAATLCIFLAFVLLAVVGYGFGQKYLGFPAFLTGNEEFAKGVALHISSLGRVPSTFGGDYDLAAYLVLIIPIMVSMIIGFKNWFVKFFFLACSVLGFGLLFLTISRVSFFVLLISLVLLLIFQKKKSIIFLIAAVLLGLVIVSPRLAQRFGGTVSEVNVLVDAKSGGAIGQVKEVSPDYFKDKVVIDQSLTDAQIKKGTTPIVPLSLIPSEAPLVVEPNAPNGESLPQGTSYINLPLSPIVKREKLYFYQKSKEHTNAEKDQVNVIYGDYVIKKAKAYDLSFTTRFQGEWPKTIEAFDKNVFLGSGYGSVTLAVDNDYLRLLGESGIFGFFSFISIFIIFGIYAKKTLPEIDSPVTKSFIFGFAAGTVGLALNAIFIDVFEASKIAFVYWILMGLAFGILGLYKKGDLNIIEELKKIITSPAAIILSLFAAVFSLLSGISSFYFVGDDFTWFRWAANCTSCNPIANALHYFISSDGFFYRPGTKIYFDLMYTSFWLNQTAYHVVSIFLHFLSAIIIFLIGNRIFKNRLLSAACAFIFAILSGSSEIYMWTAATGHLFNVTFILLSILLFMRWKESKKSIYYILCLFSAGLSLLFHELGIVAPLLIIAYDSVFNDEFSFKEFYKKVYIYALFIPIIPYLFLRFISSSHWFNGDYSYNIVKLPFNVIINAIGYAILTVIGPSWLPLYEKVRTFSKVHPIIAVPISILVIVLIFVLLKNVLKKANVLDKKIIIFSVLFFLISLIPFLGLGNISSRYDYLAGFGLVILLVLFLKAAYGYLLPNGKNISISLMVIILIVFSSSQLFQLQKIQADWGDAGNKSMNFLNAIDYIYAHYQKYETGKLYFVDVPIRSGDAWVFPVGLSDAVWLVFRSNAIKVFQEPGVEQAFAARGSASGLIFRFDQHGNLIEMRKTKTGKIEEYPIKDM